MFLRKTREPQCKQFDDAEWLEALGDAEGEDAEHLDVPESAVSDVATQAAASVASGGPAQVRPIQMGEFMRKYISRRLLAVNEGEVSRIMSAMRQLGNGMQGGAEALPIFHQLLYDVWQAGGLAKPLARIKVDEKNCFCNLEWDAIRSAALELHPKHAAVAAWKHTSASYVEQEGVAPLPKDRGAEQGDVDGPTECALTLGQVARDARLLVHQQQRLARLPWACESQAEVEAAVADFDARTLAAQNFQSQDARAPLRSLDPRHEVQKGGGLADFWYLDDGDTSSAVLAWSFRFCMHLMWSIHQSERYVVAPKRK